MAELFSGHYYFRKALATAWIIARRLAISTLQLAKNFPPDLSGRRTA